MKLWKSIVLIAFIFLFAGQPPLENSFLTGQVSAQTDTLAGRSDWNIKKSKHFIIYYQEAPQDYLNQVARKAEYYYKSITDYLGLRRFDFWTWDKRCKIYLYPSRAQYLLTTNAVSWSKGGVHVINKEIITYVGKEQFLNYVLPHEMGHIIFREVVGYEKSLPLWIDEAVAVLQEENRQRYLRAAAKFVGEGRYIPLEELSQIRSYKQVEPYVFYGEAASIMDFLLEEFGRDKFVGFCRRLRDAEHWQEALLKEYRFENLQELEQAWVNSIAQYP